MSELSTRALYYLAEVSLRISALGLILIPAAWLASRRRPELAHALWAALLAAMLILPVLTPLLPPVYLSTALAEPIVAAPPQPTLQPASPSTTTPLPAPRPSRTVAWPVLLLAAYTAVAATLLLRVAARVRRTGRILAAASPLRDDRLTAVLAPLALAQGRGYPLPALCECSDIEVPFAAGWREPTIVLPASWRTWDGPRLRAVLAHELAHIQRQDWPVSVLAAPNTSLFFFHPLAWLAERRLNALAEASCDAAALTAAGDPRHYAATLFDFAARLPHRAVPATAMARSSKVGARIERLLAQGLPTPRPMKPLAWTLLLAATLPVLYAAASLDPGQEPLPPVNVQRQAPGPILGANLTPQQAAELEQRLAQNPHDLNARASLIGYYCSHSYPEPWLKHLLWAIENHPEAALHETFPSLVAAGRSLAPDEDTHRKLEELWRRKAAQNPSNVDVLRHANLFLAESLRQLRAVPQPSAETPSPRKPTRINVGAFVQERYLIEAPPPAYPPLARQARIQGTVIFSVVINSEGNVINASLISGHPLLVQAATDAVKNYRYRPTLLNGQPVEVVTQVNVPFRLPD